MEGMGAAAGECTCHALHHGRVNILIAELNGTDLIRMSSFRIDTCTRAQSEVLKPFTRCTVVIIEDT